MSSDAYHPYKPSRVGLCATCGEARAAPMHSRPSNKMPELVWCQCGHPRAVGYACTACQAYSHLPRWVAIPQISAGERLQVAIKLRKSVLDQLRKKAQEKDKQGEKDVDSDKTSG